VNRLLTHLTIGIFLGLSHLYSWFFHLRILGTILIFIMEGIKIWWVFLSITFDSIITNYRRKSIHDGPISNILIHWKISRISSVSYRYIWSDLCLYRSSTAFLWFLWSQIILGWHFCLKFIFPEFWLGTLVTHFF